MSRYERLRTRLPSLYRPEEVDTSGELVPMRPEQLLELDDAAPRGVRLRAAQGGLELIASTPVQLRTLRFAPTLGGGAFLNLELYPIEEGRIRSLPTAVAPLEGVRASFPRPIELRHALLRLRRPGLLALLLSTTARLLDDVDLDASGVLRSHWVEHADDVRFDPFVRRWHEVHPEGSDRSAEPPIDDLARIGSLLGLLPWRDPIGQRETIESYRRRIGRFVRLYREGLGTVAAVRRAVQLQLPEDESAPARLRDLPLTIEEYAPRALARHPAEVRGPPAELIGPLMRWKLEQAGLDPAAPTLFIEGVEAEPDRIDATERPAIELFAAGPRRVRLALAYDGVLSPGEVLRIRPAYTAWVAAGSGIERADADPSAELPADPTAAAGPWRADPEWMGGAITALVLAPDRALWAATETGSLLRFDGERWSEELAGLPRPHCLALDGDDLLIGTAAGLFRLPLYPESETADTRIAPAAIEAEQAIHTLLPSAAGGWLAGTSRGLARLTTGDLLEAIELDGAPAPVPIYALSEEATGALLLGTELGVLLLQPALGHSYLYSGEDHSDQLPDWIRIDAGAPGALPSEAHIFLPPVRCLLRGPDAALWLGTDQGIARYAARSVGGPSYTAHLEAFPELGTGAVHTLVQDERGILWFGTEHGLFRFDGHDWWQLQGGRLERLALASSTSRPPGQVRHWRYHRAFARWEFLDAGSGAEVWAPFGGASEGRPEEPIRAILWTDRSHAELGRREGDRFLPDPAKTPARLRVRYKPEEHRIVEGGIPALPRLPTGSSIWRYLALEGEVDPPRITPAWTREGRLIPPPAGQEALEEGRYTGPHPVPELSRFDQAVFAYNPAARVWMSWEGREPLTLLVRVQTTAGVPRLEPVVIDRVWNAIEQVRPAGVQAMLAIDDRIVRGQR